LFGARKKEKWKRLGLRVKTGRTKEILGLLKVLGSGLLSMFHAFYEFFNFLVNFVPRFPHQSKFFFITSAWYIRIFYVPVHFFGFIRKSRTPDILIFIA